MKNFKKVLACVLSVMALSSISLIPMESSALYISDDLSYYQEHPEIIEYYQKNAITEAVLILEDAEEWSGTYYFCPVLENSSISLDSFTDEEIDSLKKACPVKIDDTVDTSAVEKVLTFKYGTDKIYIPIDTGYYYTNMSFTIDSGTTLDENGNVVSTYGGDWVIDETAIPKTVTVGDSDTTIGDSDQTIGDSKVTALRGDVNLDGDVNGLDLLYLKKYLLGLIEW